MLACDDLLSQPQLTVNAMSEAGFLDWLCFDMITCHAFGLKE